MAEGKKIGSVFVEVLMQSNKFRTGLNRAESMAKTFGNKLKSVFNKLKNFFTHWAVIVGGTLAAVFSVKKLKEFAKGIVSISSTFEQYKETLKALSDNYDEIFERLKEKAKETSMSLRDYIGAAIPLIPSFGEGDLFEKVLDSVADLSAGLKSLGVDATMVVRQFLKIKAGDFGEAFMRFREWGLDLEKMLPGYEAGKKYEADPMKVVEAMIKGIQEQFGGLAKSMANTWDGMVSNLGDAWDTFRNKIGQAGFFDNVKNKLEDILAYIDKLEKSGKLKEWAKNVSNFLEGVVDVLGYLFEKFLNLMGIDFSFDKFKKELEGVKEGVKEVKEEIEEMPGATMFVPGGMSVEWKPEGVEAGEGFKEGFEEGTGGATMLMPGGGLVEWKPEGEKAGGEFGEGFKESAKMLMPGGMFVEWYPEQEGEEAGEGFKKGFEKSVGKISMAGMKGKEPEWVDTMKAKIDEFFAYMKAKFQDKSFTEGFGGILIDAFIALSTNTELSRAIADAGANIGADLAQAIGDKFKENYPSIIAGIIKATPIIPFPGSPTYGDFWPSEGQSAVYHGGNKY